MTRVLEDPKIIEDPNEIILEVETAQTPDPFAGLTIGRIVWYVLENSSAIRPAIVVHVWDSSMGLVNVQVFPDSDRDGTTNDRLTVPLWRTSVPYDENKRVGSWHWPERKP
jgi:hypothetical protein